MDMRAFFYRAVSGIYFSLKGSRYLQISRCLERSQWWTSEQIHQFQNEELHKLIEYVYEYVPYYRKIMQERKLKPEDIKTTEDITKFPVLSKDLLRKYLNQLISTQNNSIKKYIRRTGGSTGEPLQIMNDYTNSVWENVAFYRGFNFAGYQRGDKIISLFGGTLGLAPEGKIDKLKTKFSGTVFLPAFEISQQNINKYVNEIKKSKAKFLRGYTSAIYLLAKLMDKSNITIPLIAVFPTAETLQDFQREQIEKTFQCKVFDQYGCGECNSIAFECASHSGLHISDENVFLEVLKNKERVPNGEMGALTLTTLHNYAMPLIRYQNGDIVSLDKRPCLCGRGLSRISRIYGRANDVLLSQNGELISGAFIPHLFRNTEGIEQVQLIQEEKDEIILKVVKGPKFSEKELTERIEILHKYLGDVKINVEYVSFIPTTPQGKLKSVISKFGNSLLCK